MTRALAAVFDGTPQHISLRELTAPRPGRGELLVRVAGCTLCGSDLHSFDGRRTVPVPTILGHEIVGEIEELGTPAVDVAGQPLRIGDRVTWAIVAHCGSCFYCRRGLPQKCLQAVKYGHEAFRPGRELLGGLAEYCLLTPGTSIVRLPDELPLSVACPASCATATIVAALEAAGELRDRSLCIFGAGMLGLTACAMAHALGVAQVVCVDPQASRRQRARAFGATRVAASEELGDVMRDSIDPQGFDAVLELSGHSQAIAAAVPILRMGGTLVLVGSVFPGAPMSVSPEQIVRRQLTLRGIHNYAPRHLALAVDFLAAQQRRYPFAELVSEWLPLSSIDAAFALSGQPEVIRIGVTPRTAGM